MRGRPVVTLAKDVRRSLAAGHPWIFDRAIAGPVRAAPGQVVDVVWRGERLGVGFADPGVPIAVRMLAVGPYADAVQDAADAVQDAANASAIDTGVDPGAAWIRQRARRAGACRAADANLAGSTGIRLIHGENDDMPGLVVDRYDDTAVCVFDGDGAACFWRPRSADVAAGLADAGYAAARWWAKAQRRDAGEGAALLGEPPPPVIAIDENGARFAADVYRGHKTGFYLDQRDNRARVGALSAGAEVLNLFGYTGGFSVHAALGGARRVTTVDVAKPAIEQARRHFGDNGLDPDAHVFRAQDAFAFLSEARTAGRRYDVVIADPPSFAASERARAKALTAYRRLNEAALAVVEADGLLVTASCSSHIGDADLLAIVAEAAARAGRRVRVREIRGAATDHPVHPGFPEGRYLTALFAYVA